MFKTCPAFSMFGFTSKKGRQAQPGTIQNETVIPQMVIAVADGHVERDSSKELRQIGVGVLGVALGADELRESEVVHAFAVRSKAMAEA